MPDLEASKESSSYSDVVSLFIELRGQGLSLSPADLDLLLTWEQSNIHPQFIIQVMFEVHELCQKKKHSFPRSLKVFSKHIQKALGY